MRKLSALSSESVAAAKLDDDALLAGMAAGDPVAARHLITRHGPKLIGVAYAVVGDRHTAEDVAQEAFWRAWRAADSFDPRRGTAEVWLLTICRNVAIDHLRVQRAEPFDPNLLASMLSSDVDQRRTPDEAVLAGHDSQRVRKALTALPPEQQRALVLAAIGGRTAADVGVAEGIPLGTAKSRIRSALRRLRVELEEEPFFEL